MGIQRPKVAKQYMAKGFATKNVFGGFWWSISPIYTEMGVEGFTLILSQVPATRLHYTFVWPELYQLQLVISMVISM